VEEDMSKFAVDWKTQDSEREIPSVQLWYPRVDGSAKAIDIELSDVRAADGIRVSYDFDRDGWKIEQAAVFEWDAEDDVCDPEWAEVAFIQAWARQKTPPPEDKP
jgi:hypothetical protein